MTAPTSLAARLRAAVEAVEDPELPVGIGELGMVRDIVLGPAGGTSDAHPGTGDPATGHHPTAAPPTGHHAGEDPSIAGQPVDVTVELQPTFVACPARFLIEAEVEAAVRSVAPSAGVTIAWVATGSWDPGRLSRAARDRLADVGVAVPAAGGSFTCPYCGTADVELQARAGSTLCRSLAYCPSCQNPFEVFRHTTPTPVTLGRAAAT